MHIRALYLLVVTLSGCAMSDQSSDWMSEDVAGPEPVAYRYMIASALPTIVGGSQLQANVMEISSPRRVDSIKGATWLVCVKLTTQGSRREQTYFYTASIQREKIIDSRGSVGIDACEHQTYSVFDWKAELQQPPPLLR